MKILPQQSVYKRQIQIIRDGGVARNQWEDLDK